MAPEGSAEHFELRWEMRLSFDRCVAALCAAAQLTGPPFGLLGSEMEALRAVSLQIVDLRTSERMPAARRELLQAMFPRGLIVSH